MFLYTALEAVVAVIAGILLAVCTRKSEEVTYGKLDRVGRITNILLLLIYLCLSPFVMIFGMISHPAYGGILGIVGWIVAILNASAMMFCGLGLGFSVRLRKKGKSGQSFAVQFLGLAGIAFTVGMYALLAGNLLQSLN